MNRGNKAFRAALAALTLLLCAALCAAAVSIYARGMERRAAAGDLTAPVFTRALAGEGLVRLLPLLGLWLVSLLGALFTGGGPEKNGKYRDTAGAVALLRTRVAQLPPECGLEANRRRTYRLAAGLAAGALGLFALWYLLDGRHFESWDLETVMGRALWHVGLPSLLLLAVLLARDTLVERSLLRERAALTAALRAGGRADPPAPLPEDARQGRGRDMPALRLALYAAALALLILGIWNGGLNDVLVKAINICTECIGLG